MTHKDEFMRALVDAYAVREVRAIGVRGYASPTARAVQSQEQAQATMQLLAQGGTVTSTAVKRACRSLGIGTERAAIVAFLAC